MKTIDSIQPPTRQPQPSQLRPEQPQGTGARFTAFTKTPRRRRAWGMILALAISPVLFALALVNVIGIGAMIIYGIIALVRRWPSRLSFALALAALVYMIILQLAAANDWAQSMAVLAYVLLAIGVISLAMEVKMSSRMWFKKH
jgi:hypothetical protein